MKLLAALCAALLLLAAQEKPEDSALVKAAKAAGGKRKSTTKVITNADVKKAAAKKPLSAPPKKTAEAPAAATAPAKPKEDAKSPLEKEDELYHARKAATKRADDAEERVARVEAEMRRLELAYYSESDLNYRDTVLVDRFNQVRKQLEEARAELAGARDALSKLQ